MGILAFFLFGLITSLIARALMSERQQSMGLLFTTLLGVAGSIAGGLLGSLIFGGTVRELHASGVAGSVVGAMFVMALAGLLGPRPARRPMSATRSSWHPRRTR